MEDFVEKEAMKKDFSNESADELVEPKFRRIILRSGKPISEPTKIISAKEIKRGGKLKKSIVFTIILLILIILGFLYYFFDYFPKPCNDAECYQNALLNCRKVFYVKEEKDYVWRYDILGKNNRYSCNVRVSLLKVKQGDIKTEDFRDKEMVCVVQMKDDVFPEKDMLRCSGTLREELQEIIIDRLHNYIIQNLGEINEAIGEI